jgi:hypothetical protein
MCTVTTFRYKYNRFAATCINFIGGDNESGRVNEGGGWRTPENRFTTVKDRDHNSSARKIAIVLHTDLSDVRYKIRREVHVRLDLWGKIAILHTDLSDVRYKIRREVHERLDLWFFGGGLGFFVRCFVSLRDVLLKVGGGFQRDV